MGINIIKKLKNNEIRIPIGLGQILSAIPYSVRPIVGKNYNKHSKEILDYERMDVEKRRTFIFSKIRSIVNYAFANIEFYKDFYSKHGFSPEYLKSFDDIEKIPIITKHDLLNYSIEARTNMNKSKFLVNTGGSSGFTLSFYVMPEQIGNEWAHIHEMWGKIGYKQSDLKLYIAGRSKVRNGVDYEFARHQLSVDMYRPYFETAPLLKKILQKHPCYYLHGYPSVLAEFAEYCQQDIELLSLLKGKLHGAFMSSEYPYPAYRDKIENTFEIVTQSFYGHTERCVMAWETEQKFLFKPFQTYGYAEAVKNSDGHYDLIGTSYFNEASPLIRYNTQDIIDNPDYESGILQSFNIFEGRSGQFILDCDGRKISLTGLVMGRHHLIFDFCSHIQISQEKQGFATIYYVPKDNTNVENPQVLFDSSNVNISFSFRKLDAPVRTVSGKINLLIPEVK